MCPQKTVCFGPGGQRGLTPMANFVVRVVEDKPNVQFRVGFSNQQHLLSIRRVEEALRFQDDSIREHKVRSVCLLDCRDGVAQLQRLVLVGHPGLVQGFCQFRFERGPESTDSRVDPAPSKRSLSNPRRCHRQPACCPRISPRCPPRTRPALHRIRTRQPTHHPRSSTGESAPH